eukprot:288538-Rhodomonas_salina.3
MESLRKVRGGGREDLEPADGMFQGGVESLLSMPPDERGHALLLVGGGTGTIAKLLFTEAEVCIRMSRESARVLAVLVRYGTARLLFTEAEISRGTAIAERKRESGTAIACVGCVAAVLPSRIAIAWLLVAAAEVP